MRIGHSSILDTLNLYVNLDCIHNCIQLKFKNILNIENFKNDFSKKEKHFLVNFFALNSKIFLVFFSDLK
jgi:hypothetical protein